MPCLLGADGSYYQNNGSSDAGCNDVVFSTQQEHYNRSKADNDRYAYPGHGKDQKIGETQNEADTSRDQPTYPGGQAAGTALPEHKHRCHDRPHAAQQLRGLVNIMDKSLRDDRVGKGAGNAHVDRVKDLPSLPYLTSPSSLPYLHLHPVSTGNRLTMFCSRLVSLQREFLAPRPITTSVYPKVRQGLQDRRYAYFTMIGLSLRSAAIVFRSRLR